MNQTDVPQPSQVLAGLLVLLAIFGCIAVWGRVASRWIGGLPVLPYQPRRPVPWGGGDLVLSLLFYLAMQVGVVATAHGVFGRQALAPPVMYDPDKIDMSHIVARLMVGSGMWTLLLCMVSVVLIAPIVEEFFFRVLLQGWFDKLERRNRRRLPTLRWFMPHGLWPILLSSFLFARLHFRVGPPEVNMKTFAWLLAGDGVAKLLTMVFTVGWLRWRVGATAVDFGWVPKKLLGDIRLGLIGFVMMAAPVYGLQFVLVQVLPKYLAPDPFPLFFLAAMLGLLYYRTHRMMPSVTVHAALNATSFVLLWLQQFKPG
jgi:membrane protease YdiL (CAAX protease family)